MKKTIIPLLLAVCLLSGCGDTGPWEMPQVDAAPTPEPTTAPVFSNASPESYIWNEIVSFNMSDPGVSGDRFEQELSPLRRRLSASGHLYREPQPLQAPDPEKDHPPGHPGRGGTAPGKRLCGVSVPALQRGRVKGSYGDGGALQP